MTTRRKPAKDRTSLVISIVLHVLLIGGVAYWAYKTGRLEQVRQAVLQYVRSDKKTPAAESKPVSPRTAPPPKLPPINQGLPPASGGGTRRAVAADAPEAAGGSSFFQDTRRQSAGPSTAGAAGPTNRPALLRPAVAVAPPKPPSFRPPPATTIRQLMAERAKDAAATEAFGSEQISRSGASDAGAIVNKISGAAIVEGKFAVIRGLSDRYVTTTLNGGEIPSADPYRRSASLDLFPAQIIDKVVVAKTFTPDQQGAFTGGGINIATKSFPERPFSSFSLGASYNTQANLIDDFLTYPGGDTDWLGMDDGSRALPPELAVPNLVIPNPPSSTGTFPPGSPTYVRRTGDADRLNALTHAMGYAELAGVAGETPLNTSMSLATGQTTHLFRRPLGVFGSMSYRQDYGHYENGVSRRQAAGDEISYYEETRSTRTINWSSMVNFALQLHPDHEVSFNFLYNQNGDDQVRHQEGYRLDTGYDIPITRERLYWTERNLQTYQLKGAHQLPEVAGLKFDWLAVYSDTSQQEPDARFFNYLRAGDDYYFGDPRTGTPVEPTRYYRDLAEQNRNLKADLTLPFRQWTWDEAQIKVGLWDSTSERSFTDKGVYYLGQPSSFNGRPNEFLEPANLGSTSTTNAAGRITWNWRRYVQDRDSRYDAESAFRAGYAMLDLPLLPAWRFVGGVRYEITDMTVDSRSDLDGNGSFATNAIHVLPALGLVWQPRTNMNVRLHYSQTIARPSFRELAKYSSYDPVLDEVLIGNPNLLLSDVDNFDLRWEWFPRPGELLSASLFFKDLRNPVEQIIALDQETITFTNRPTAQVWGVEFEARQSLQLLSPLLREFSLGGNFSWIQSETELFADEYKNKIQYVPDLERTRPLYDQSPYIFNADLSYDNPRLGTSASLLLNLAAPRVAIAVLTTDDVYEHPPTSLDFTLSQRLGRQLSLKFSARNLLDPAIKRTYGDDPNGPLYSYYRRGRSFGLGLSYDF